MLGKLKYLALNGLFIDIYIFVVLLEFHVEIELNMNLTCYDEGMVLWIMLICCNLVIPVLR